MEYTFVLPTAFYRTGEGTFVCESAFAEHLALLRDRLDPKFTSVRVCGPRMSDEDYRRVASHVAQIDEQRDRIYLTELNPQRATALGYWLHHAIPNARLLWNIVRRAGLVHSGPSMNVFHPNETIALVCAKLQGRKTIAVTDIDIRNDIGRAVRVGMITRGRYIAEFLVFEPLRRLQLRWAAANCSLVLFKGSALVADYGRDRPWVKNFLDPAHSARHVIPVERLERKTERVRSGQGPLRCIYFGRFVQRKGVDLCIRSIVEARQKLGRDVTLTVMGDGTDKDALVALVAQLGAQDYIRFAEPVAFGPAFYDALYDYDVLLAAPITEDTPRSAFDAMASGMALCAYDTEYYRTLEGLGPTVLTSPWMSVEGMAANIGALAADRPRVAVAQQSARRLALENTQESWLDIRAQWTREFCSVA